MLISDWNGAPAGFPEDGWAGYLDFISNKVDTISTEQSVLYKWPQYSAFHTNHSLITFLPVRLREMSQYGSQSLENFGPESLVLAEVYLPSNRDNDLETHDHYNVMVTEQVR